MGKALLSDEKQQLLRLAREALEAAVCGRTPPPLDLGALPERLRIPAATFVTLTRGEVLRGCIGALDAKIPLAQDVQEHAVAAALHDFRFPPVRPVELEFIGIEVSVLTAPQPLEYSQPEEIPDRLQPGVDGVIVISGPDRATFLPQVWEKVAEPKRFLDMLCQKAGIARDAWRKGGVRVLTYQVESFHQAPISAI
ncbi:MAG: AmmeMemoRadiSam system protein A [Anaerolineales bacterium]|jgi:AmmeMemoRadiSam system protein A